MASSPTRQHRHGVSMFKCTSMKAGYPTHAAALDAAESLMEQGRVDPGCHITPYQCGLCGEHHVYNRRIVRVPGQLRPEKWRRKQRHA